MGDLIFCSYQAESPEDGDDWLRVWSNPTGGTLDGWRRPKLESDEGCDAGDTLILPGGGAAVENGGAGGEPGIEGSVGGDGSDGSGGSAEGGRVLAFRSRGRREKEGLSRRLIALELQEHQADLRAFQDAYSCIHKRVQEVKDEGQLMKLVEWSGTSAVMGSLELAVHSMERVVDELKGLLKCLDDGVIYNTDEDCDE